MNYAGKPCAPFENVAPANNALDALEYDLFNLPLAENRLFNQENCAGRQVVKNGRGSVCPISDIGKSRNDICRVKLPDGTLRKRLEFAYGLDPVPPEFNPQRMLSDKRKHIQNPSTDGKIPVPLNKVLALELPFFQLVHQTLKRVFNFRCQYDGPFAETRGRRKQARCRFRRSNHDACFISHKRMERLHHGNGSEP